MSKQEPTHKGIVLDLLPNTQFRVEELETKKIVRCYLAGKMRKFNINVLLGDTVDFVWSGNEGEIGRITRRTT